jgi:hypothetical protein
MTSDPGASGSIPGSDRLVWARTEMYRNVASRIRSQRPEIIQIPAPRYQYGPL